MYFDEQILEFQKILGFLKSYVITDLGKQLVFEIHPMTEEKEIKRKLSEVSEAVLWIIRYGSAPMDGVFNVREPLKRSQIGSRLNSEEILRILSMLEAASRSVAYEKKIRQLEIETTYLSPYYSEITTHPKLRQEINYVFDEKGVIRDDASSELASIRKKRHTLEKRIEEKMASLLHSEALKLTDQVVAFRNNRLVLPVKSEYKNSFKGIIHDQSASKETVFMEPLSCVNMNNDLQSLDLEEQAEIDRILYTLTVLIATDSEDILHNLVLFTELDIIFGKAKYAIENNMSAPEITKSTIHLLQARHPLIPKDEVVANDLSFFQYRNVIITGPNTGGKTVSLKTLGLLSIMVQSGMLIPVADGSKTMIFSSVFADIGDEQSIEQSLSTFSSHITKIIYILRNLEENSLILLDELGSGTDPKEGASLAMSILNYLRKLKVYSMVSTHYPELKLYAYDLEDTVNASVEFDIDSLKPTYRLQIGVPGSSNAIDIASRLGLFREIIEDAKKVSLEFDNDTSNLVKKLDQQSKDLKQEYDEVHKQKIELENKIAALEKEKQETKKKYNRWVEDYTTSQELMIDEERSKINALIDELDQMRKSGDYKEHELAKIKYESKQLGQNKKDYQKVNTKKIQVGDIVNVIPYQREGIVMKIRSNGDFNVQMGTLSAIFKEKDLEFTKNQVSKQKEATVKVNTHSEARAELDLRGLRYEEAMEALDKYIDTCLMNHLEFAYIIHGYGTGALRTGVEKYIKASSHIKSSRRGGAGEGGSGVTIVYFK